MVTDCLKQSCWDFFFFGLLITAGIWKQNRLCLLEIRPDCETKGVLSPSFSLLQTLYRKYGKCKLVSGVFYQKSLVTSPT